MLNSLVIKNFRMLEDFTIEKLGRVNLIVGKNNSGKSTILEALRIYAGNAKFDLLDNISESHDELMYHNDRGDWYEGLFTGREYGNKSIFIGESIPEERNISLSVFYEDKMTPKIKRNNVSVNNPNYVEPEDIFCSFIPTKFIEIEALEREWNEINLTDNEDIVTQALQIIIPEFKRLAFDGNKEKRWVKVKLANLSKPIPLKSLGDGMLRILQIAIKLISAQGGFLLIDEFENGLHYSVQENVWRLLFEMAEKLDIQVFATTHSWDCIESFTKIALENDKTEGISFRMGKSAINRKIGEREIKKGQIIATVYDKEALYDLTQMDMELR